MHKHTFFSRAKRTALPACKLILIITAFLSTATLAQDQAAPADLAVYTSTNVPFNSTLTLGDGRDIRLSIRVDMIATGVATGIIVTAEIPEGLTFVSTNLVSANNANCSYADNRLTCTLGTIINKGRKPMEGFFLAHFLFRPPTRTGSLNFTTGITANEPDPNLSNNISTTTAIVTKSRKRVRFF